MDKLRKLVKEKLREVMPQVIEWRRDFHREPELGFKEFKTSEKIASLLRSFGLEVTEKIAVTGVVGVLEGSETRKTIGLRADMDALPIEEKTDLDFASINKGIMHACGHDGHMAILLGVASILSSFKEHLKNKVVFIFQPSEEGPKSGMAAMLEENLLERFPLDMVLGVHLWNIKAGKVALGEKSFLAAADTFNLTILGKGGHAASPHKTIDPIAVSAQVICALQNIRSRQVDSRDPFVLTIGSIRGGNRSNIIPDKVVLKGTIRTLSEKTREKVLASFKKIVNAVTSAFGADYELEFIGSHYPVLIPDTEVTHQVRETAEEIVGLDKVLYPIRPSLGGEDFAYLLQKVPGTFVILGADRGGKKANNTLHHGCFNFDETALEVGVELFSTFVLTRN